MSDLLDAFDRQLRRDVIGGETNGSTVIWVDDGWHRVIWSDLDERNADAEIARALARLRSLGGKLEWKLYGHDGPADLPRRLEAAGLVPGEVETVLVAEIAALDLETELDVRIARDQETMEQASPRAVGVVCFVSDVPVSTARIELPPGSEFATLWGGCTLPQWRGRGAYRATVTLRAQIARERGYRYLVVDAQPASRPILERLGFVALTTTIPYTPA